MSTWSGKDKETLITNKPAALHKAVHSTVHSISAYTLTDFRAQFGARAPVLYMTFSRYQLMLTVQNTNNEPGQP